MGTQRVKEVEDWLKKINEVNIRDSESTKDAIVDLSEIITTGLSYEDEDLCISILFKEGGLVEFCKAVACDNRFINAKKEALDLFNYLFEKKSLLVMKYANQLEKLSRQLYNANDSSKVRCSALNLFCTLLLKASHKLEYEEFDFGRFVEQLYIDLKKNKGSLVMYHQLVTLGILCYCCPEKVTPNANLILKILKEQLIKKTGRQPDLTVAAGAVKGLSYYINNFPQGLEDNSAFYSDLYPHIHKLLNPELKLPKREAQRAALDLIFNHGAKFAEHLFKNHEVLFKWLIIWCRSSNRDDHKAGVKAIDTFIVVIANALELHDDDDGQGVQIFKFLLKEFNELIESSKTSSHISLAVKGYGLLSGACKMYLSSDDVFKMFSRVLAVSHQGFFQSSEMLETKVSNLPSYVESLGFIISKLDNVTVGMVDSVLHLALALVENFPYLSQFKLFLAYRAFFTLLASLSEHSEIYGLFMHNFVYHFIVHCCSFEPLMEKEMLEGDPSESSFTSSEHEEKYTNSTGIKGKKESFKDYLPLWRAFLTPEKVGDVKVSGRPVSSLTSICFYMYEEFLECTLEISEKLDLTTFKDEDKEKLEDSVSENEEANSNPVKGLKAKTPKDFQIYMNMFCLMEAVIPLQSGISLDHHLNRLFLYYIKRSTCEPLVSTHYSVITLFLYSANQINYFHSDSGVEVETAKHLITSYVLEVLKRCKQYKNNLLACCLTLILRIPMCVVEKIIPELVSPLQISLQMGLSFLPIAKICISALKLWTQNLRKENIQSLFPKVLPFLLPYLRSKESLSEAEMQTRVITVRMSLATQRRKINKRVFEEGKRMEESAMRKVQLEILDLLGHLDQKLCVSLVADQSETVFERAVAWDAYKHVLFSMPFQQIKLEIYFDEILPETIDKALNSSDRQTKVASCELLHSLIILMIGTGHQQSAKTQEKVPMTALYIKVFKAILTLSCDTDNVTRQLFLTLTFQIIHWFTNNKSFEHPDTAALLQVIMDCIVTPNDPSLRDLSAECLFEFIKWSRKQSRSTEQAKLNIKSVLKRIISLCKHPSAYKRLGGCLAWNSIYREVREDSVACDEWMVLLLTTFIFCLNCCQNDDELIGTKDQCQNAVDHVERIFIVRSKIFNKASSTRRLPSSMEKGNLPEILEWLFEKISAPNSFVRHASMKLIMSLAAVTQGFKSGNDFIQQMMHKQNLDFLLETIQKPLNDDKLLKPDYNVMNYKEMRCRLENLLASLDSFLWISSRHVFDVDIIFSESCEKILFELKTFVKEACLKTGNELLKESQSSSELICLSSHVDKLNQLRCSTIVRVIDLISIIFQNEKPSCSQGFSLLDLKMKNMIFSCLFNPEELGFDLRDAQVITHLPQRVADLLMVMLKKLPKTLIEEFKLELFQYVNNYVIEGFKHLPENLDAKCHIPSKIMSYIKGLETLHISGWTQNNSELSLMSEEIFTWLENVLYTSREGVEYAKKVNPKHNIFLEEFLQLAISLNPKLLKRAFDLFTSNSIVVCSDGKEIKKGTHILDVLGDIPFILLVQDPCFCMKHSLELMSAGHVPEGLNILTRIMKVLIKKGKLRAQYSSKLIEIVLNNWDSIFEPSFKSQDNKESFLTFIMTSFMADKEGIISSKLKKEDKDGKALSSFYHHYLCDSSVSLASKANALKLLPFFVSGSGEESIIKNTLQNFRMSYLPLKFSEFELGSLRERELKSIASEFLMSLQLAPNIFLLDFIIRLFCCDDGRRYEEELQKCLSTVMKNVQVTKQIEILQFLYNFLKNSGNQVMRLEVLERVFLPCLHHSSPVAIETFFTGCISHIVSVLNQIVCGRNDEQQKVIVTKYIAFSLIQILYSKLPKERLATPGSEINSAYDAKDITGKELTKEILKRSVRTAKGELRRDLTHQELRRKCSSSAYNALISVLTNVQDQLKFYHNFIFSENSMKDEAIFESFVNVDKTFEFDIEVNFEPGRKNRFATVHSKNKSPSVGGLGGKEGTVQYIASHYLYDSSLKEDLSQYDFSSSVILTQAASAVYKREHEVDGGMTVMKLDQSDFNNHEVMPNLIAVIRHVVDNKIMQLYSGDDPPSLSDLPQWMLFLKSKLENPSTKVNIKLFILRLIINTEDVFEHYGNLFVVPMLNCVVGGIIGRTINYFIADLFVTILSWGEIAVPSDKNLAFEVFKFLVSCSPHIRADISKYNLNLIKVFVETWKTALRSPSHEIFTLLEYENGSKREIESGIHISGILLSNKLSPYNEESSSEQQRFTSILNSLMAKSSASIHRPAAEVLGLYFKFVASKGEGNESLEKISQNLASQISSNSKQLGQFLTCVHHIHVHFPEIISKLIGRILAVLPRLYGIHRERVLQCLVSYSSQIEDIFAHMKEQNILNSLQTKEAKTQLVSLELVKSSLPRLEPGQIVYFLPGILSLKNHSAPLCRKLMYETFMWIYDKFRGIKGMNEEMLTEEAQTILLKGTKDEDAVLRQSIKNFWIQRAKNLSIIERLLFVMENLFTSETDDCFLPIATYILLEATHSSADFLRPIFSYPLTECVFKEMKVSPGWRTQHLSMIPLFVSSQAADEGSIHSLISMTQEGRMDDDEDDRPGTSNAIPGPRATQKYAFSVTQNQGSVFDNTYNWVTGSTLDSSLADKEFNITHAANQSSSSGLFFTGSSKENVKRSYRGVSSSDETDSGAKELSRRDPKMGTLLRRRFVVNKDREKETVHFARQEEIRRKMRNQIEVERKQKREAQVTLYRQYRVGELPDVQIPHKALISPLQALAERDDNIASQIFQLLFEAIVQSSSSILSQEEEKQWRDKLSEALRNIIKKSDASYPYVVKPLLHIALTLNIDVNPEEISLACMRNSLEPMGILLLEKQHMRQKKEEKVNEPVKKRARKDLTSSSPSIKGDTTLWINIAEMYKNLSRWDSVLGILKSEIGDLKDETIKALEAESEKNHIEAYKNYVNALKKDTWDSPPSPQEQQVWEEWFITSAENLGQWEKVEEFIEGRFLSDGNDRHERLSKVWKLPQSVASFVLPSLVNAKLMKILQGSEDDGDLCNFINESRKNDRYRLILENELSLQTSVLAINQEEFELARSLLRASQLSFLSRFLHCSLLSSTSLVEYLKIVQALSELKDFLKLYSLSADDKKEECIKNVVSSWSTVESEINTNITQTQFTMSSRNLYLNILRPYFESDSEFLNKVNITSEISMVALSLANSNPHLAQQHLIKLEKIPKDEFMECKLNFLKTEVNVMRGNLKDPYGKLHYSIEAWCKYLGKVNSYLSSNSSTYIESRYLLQESLLCLNICEAIRDLKDEWNPEDKFMKILSQKFDVGQTSKEIWFSSLLKCGHNALLKADMLLNLDQPGCNDVDKKDLYGTIASFYESCLDEWKEYESDDEFTDAYVRFILKGMSNGSKNAHHTFPRLIYLLEYNTNLGISFSKESKRVPAWMFLLWVSHILIYLDKAPGQYLLPIIKLLAETYPQAVIYSFEVSKEAYKFTGSYGLQAKKSCEEIEHILGKYSLIYNFIDALSLVHLPQLELKSKLNKIAKQKDKETMCHSLKECFDILKPSRQLKNSSGERGAAYVKHDDLKKALGIFVKCFGQNGEKLKALSVDKLLKGAKEMFNSLEMKKKSLSRNLSDYSPWLAAFNSSNYRDEIETPGQYRGLSKPILEYHTKISSFNQNLLLLQSLRIPMRITINGSDEKEYSFLIKYGEDLRTDQRVENLFSLMNNAYNSNCSDRLSCKPSLITFQVIPFRVDFGILEWVGQTTPILSFMTMFATDVEKKSFEEAFNEYDKNQSWVLGPTLTKKDDCIRKFENIVNKVPWDLMRRGLFRLSINYEGFFYIRSSFISSYATMCISHWLLGIGDRHLSNVLLNKKSGNAVGIDFGHHFETATQFLPIPELVPFRLTNQIINVMQPLGIKGQFRETMISCLHALKKERNVIFAAVQAFVKEPTEDWVSFVSSKSEENESEKLHEFSLGKMKDFRKKLYGENPMNIFVSAISCNNHVKRHKKVSELKDIIIGKGLSERFKTLQNDNLTVGQQVDILIDQATDPNILGRFWKGWQPYL